MILTDFLLTLAHLCIWISLFLTNKDSIGAFIVLSIFGLTVLYTGSPYYNMNLDSVNHGVQAVLFLAIFMNPVVKFIDSLNIYVKVLLIVYALVQFGAMIDSLMYGENGIFGMKETFYYDSFLYIQISVDILILLALWNTRSARYVNNNAFDFNTHTNMEFNQSHKKTIKQ